MKISTQDINKQKEKTFHPFNIILTIEDESDLEDLAVRFGLHPYFVEKESYRGLRAKDDTEVWEQINNLLNTKPYMK